MTDQETQSPRLLAAGTLIALQVAVSLVAGFLVQLRALEIPGCSPSCDYSLIGTASLALWVTFAILLIASSLGVYLLWRSGRATWWPPALGTFLAVVAAIVSNVVTTAGLTP